MQEMEESYLPPPLSIVHFIVGHILDKKQAKREQRNAHAHEQDNKWFDTVIRSSVIDCLEVSFIIYYHFIIYYNLLSNWLFITVANYLVFMTQFTSALKKCVSSVVFIEWSTNFV